MPMTARRSVPLLDRIESCGVLTADGAFDRDDVYAEVAARHPDAAVSSRRARARCRATPPRPRRRSGTRIYGALPSAAAWAGRRPQGYNWRALVEADIARWKRVIGDGLRSQTDGRQATEVAIAADVLNRMLELGRPEYVRIA
jgi:hypothetical protein